MGRGAPWRPLATANREQSRPEPLWAAARRVGASKVRAQAEQASILDGETLRLSGHVRSSAGRSASTAPLEVWLHPQRRLGGTGVRLCTAEVERQPRGGATFEAAAALEVAGGQPDIRPGTWGVYVREPGRGPMAVGAPPPGRDGGPTLTNPRSPRTGLWYRLRTSATGRLTVQVQSFPPHAEVEHVGLHLTELAIRGRVVGTALTSPSGEADAAPIALRCSEQRSGRVRSVPVRLGHGFSADADPELFAVSGNERCTWLMALAAPGRKPLVLGRYLDDMRRPATAYRYPAVVIGSGSPNATRLRITYDDDRRLVLHADPAAGEERS